MKKLSKLFKPLISVITCLSIVFLGFTPTVAATQTMEISIYAAVGVTSSSGSSGSDGAHAWIVIKNNYGSIKIGTQTINAGDSITMGNWGNLSKKGIWYGVERNRINQYKNNSNTVYLKRNISHTYAAAITRTMENNNYWGLIHNCTHFATRVWNAAGGSIGSHTTPSQLRNKIMTYSSYRTGTNDSDFRNASSSEKWYWVNAAPQSLNEEEIQVLDKRLNPKLVELQ